MAVPSSAHARLAVTLYRSLLRTARHFDALGVRPAAAFPAAPAAAAFPSAAALVRSRGAAARAVAPGGAAAGALLDEGFSALREMRARAALLAAAPGALAAARAGRPAGVFFSVGAVVWHRTAGYRGVVTAWAPRCEASPKWMARNGITAPEQPFYTILADVGDVPGGRACVMLVAQSELALLSGGEARAGAADPCQCEHPLLRTHFEAYHAGGGFYVPGPALAASFPADAPGAWAPTEAPRASAAERAALRLRVVGSAEPEPEPEPEADPEAVPVPVRM